MANNNDEGVNNNLNSSKDSGLDKSFVGKFVSNIINTTPFSKWFLKETTTKNAGEVRRRKDIDDDDFSCLLHPVKRAKLSHTERNNLNVNLFESPVSVHNTSNNTTTHVFSKFPEPAPGPSGIKSTKFLKKHSTFSTISSPVEENGSDSDSEEELRFSIPSASAVKSQSASSNIRKLDSSKEPIRTAPKSRSLFTSLNELSHTRSLFNDRKLKLNSSLSSRRPNFNASTFGSSTFVDKTLSTKTILSSPFYNGNTIYGGASAYEHRFGKSNDDLMSHVSRPNSVQIKPVNTVKSTSENSILSKTARRILQTLEQYSTPISDAKRIPIKPREGILSKYVGVTPYTIREKKKQSNNALQVPSIPALLQMKQKERLQNSTVSVRKTATTSQFALNQQEYKLRTEGDEFSKQRHVNKIKSSVTSLIRQKAQPVETVEEVHLPAVTLPITSLPKFDLVMMSTSYPQQQTKQLESDHQPQIAVSTEPSLTKKETDTKIVKEDIFNNYTFSKPLLKSQNRKSLEAIKCFTFGRPVNKKSKIMNFSMSDNHEITPKQNGENIKPFSQRITGTVMNVIGKKCLKSTKEWECPICLVTNEENKTICVACEEPRPRSESTSEFGVKFKISKDMWECRTCMLRNNNSNNACVACTTSKSTSYNVGVDNKIKAPTNTWKSSRNSTDVEEYRVCTTSKLDSTVVNNSNSFISQFTSTNDTWECDTCLIRNNNELEKCAACETNRKKSAAPSSITISLREKFKPSTDIWECGTCLIRNKSDLVKCAACETSKLSEKSAIEINKTGYSGPKYNFGIKPLEWECKTCLIKNKNQLTKCAACESQKVVTITEENSFGDAFKMKSGDWECTSCLVKNKGHANICICCGVIKSSSINNKPIIQLTSEKKPVNSFNFGIDIASQFSFGIPQTKKQGVAPAPIVSVSTSSNSIRTPTFAYDINNQKPTDVTTIISQTTINSTNSLLKPNEKLPVPPTTTTKVSDLKIPNTSSVAKLEASQNDTGHSSDSTFQFKSTTVNGEINKNLFSFGQTTESNQVAFLTPVTTSSSLATFKSEEKITTTTAATVCASQSYVFNDKAAKTFTTSSIQSTCQFNSKPEVSSHSESFKYFQPKEAPIFNIESKSIEQPTFKFGNKPAAQADQSSTSSTTTESNLFKFSASITSPSLSNAMKRNFGDNDKSNLNGFGSTAKLTSFVNSQDFVGIENKSFPFGTSVNDKLSTVTKPNFSFGQINKPNSIGSSNSAFSFGSNATSVPATGVAFDFTHNSLPNTGFDFSGSNGKTEASIPSLNAQSLRENMFRPGGNAGAKNCTFNFGSNANNNNQKAIFSFGASQTAQPPTQSTFNFGPSAPLAVQPSGFSFTGLPPSYNPTSIAEGNSSMAQPQQRKIRKAIRRTPR